MFFKLSFFYFRCPSTWKLEVTFSFQCLSKDEKSKKRKRSILIQKDKSRAFLPFQISWLTCKVSRRRSQLISFPCWSKILSGSYRKENLMLQLKKGLFFGGTVVTCHYISKTAKVLCRSFGFFHYVENNIYCISNFFKITFCLFQVWGTFFVCPRLLLQKLECQRVQLPT